MIRQRPRGWPGRAAEPLIVSPCPPLPVVCRVRAHLAIWLLWAIAAGAGAQPLTAPPPAPALAAPAPQTCPDLPQADDEQTPQSLLQQLEPWQELCLRSAPYFRLRGQLQLRTGQALLATQSLERALLLEPEHPGTQLDYVQALVALGDLRSAQQLLAQLIDRPDVPPALRPLLQAQRAQIEQTAQRLAQAPPSAASATPEGAQGPGPLFLQAGAQRWTLTQSLVRDTNLNNAPSAQSLTLTLPQGNITLPVEPAALPQAGSALQTELQWLALRPDGAALWLWQADLRYRHTPQTAQRYTQIEAAATWLQAPDAPQQWLARLSAGQLNWANNRAYESLKANWQHQALASSDPAAAHPATPCRRTLGAEWELRRQPAAPIQAGQYSGLTWSWQCQSPATPLHATGLPWQRLRWSSQLRLGQDQPQQASRPGGAQTQLEWRNEWAARWNTAQLQLEYSLSGLADSSGYSPLLDNNARRRVWRHGMQATLIMPWPSLGGLAALPVPEVVLQLEHAQQRSNLPAFASRQTALRLGLRWVLP